MKDKKAVSLLRAIAIISLVLLFSLYVTSSVSIFKKYKITGYSVSGEEKLLGLIGDRMPSNSFSTDFQVVKYNDTQWIDTACYKSALEACKAIYPGTTYVKETTEIASFDVWSFKPCVNGRLFPSYIYLDYCYGKIENAISIDIDVIVSNETGIRNICEKNYMVKSWHSCPCSASMCGSGSIVKCETQRSTILSLLLQQNMVKCKEQCQISKISECNKDCDKGYMPTGKMDC